MAPRALPFNNLDLPIISEGLPHVSVPSLRLAGSRSGWNALESEPVDPVFEFGFVWRKRSAALTGLLYTGHEALGSYPPSPLHAK